MINRHLGIMGIDEAVEKAVQYREQGYHSIKMKIGTDVEEDIRRVCAVRDAVGYEMKLRVDANAGYSYSMHISLFERPVIWIWKCMNSCLINMILMGQSS